MKKDKITKELLSKEQKKEQMEVIRSKLIYHLNNFCEEIDKKKYWIPEDGDMLLVDWYASIIFGENDELGISFDLDCPPNIAAEITHCLCWNKIKVVVYDNYYLSNDTNIYWEEEAFEKRWEDRKREVLEFMETVPIWTKGNQKNN